MKLKLNNLVYTTTDENKILELQELGAIVIEDTDIKDETTKIDKTSNLKNLTVEELEALIDEKGIDRKGIVRKADLIALLK
ncbi:ABC-type metal ion transport system substrate-binding protein [Peptoniphilus olsenii]|uniref:ABC-type metal ion transport system substrate-binding protein n=1 Tax=Peptoniphilus olsenii TaxID=411570 RepID=A0ABV2J9Y1_9FIRM